MAEIWDETQLVADGFERVHVELDWYDGPRAGIADVGGEPHYFERYGDYDENYDDRPDEYKVWPASDAVLELEREQWVIFVRWNERYEAGTAGVEDHPGSGGIDARYDELQLLLAQYRQAPDDARRLAGERRFDGGARYRVEGLDYWFRWCLAGESAGLVHVRHR